MFEDQNVLAADIQQNGELIKALYPARQRRPLQQMDNYRDLLAASGI